MHIRPGHPTHETHPRVERTPERRGLLSCLIAVAAASAASCSAPSESDDATSRGVSPARAAADSRALGVRGTLLHTARVGGSVRVEFWRTEEGAVVVARGSLDSDHEISNRVSRALESRSVLEAYRSLPGTNDGTHAPRALVELDAEMMRRRAARPEPSEQELTSFDQAISAHETAPRWVGPASPTKSAPAASAVRAQQLAQGAEPFDWNADFTRLRAALRTTASLSDTGVRWAQATAKSAESAGPLYGHNHSFSTGARIGSRIASFRDGGWSWQVDAELDVAPRTYVGIARFGTGGALLRDGWVSGHAVADLESPRLTVTTALGDEPRVSLLALATPFVMKGYNFNLFGMTLFNRCAHTVVSRFNGLFARPGRIRYQGRGGQRLPPFNEILHTMDSLSNHIQGVSRLPGIDDNRWFAVSRSHNDLNRAGMFLVHLGDVAAGTDGTRLTSPSNELYASLPSGAPRRTEYYYRIPFVHHPGGMQQVGKMLAVGVENLAPLPAYVNFYDLTTPGSTTAFIQTFSLDGNQGENPKPTRFVGGVGITRLSDARFLLSVLGKDNANDVWFYVSDTTSIFPSTRWSYLGYVGAVSPAAQNAQLITECVTGDIYLMATGNASFGNPFINDEPLNRADLWRLGYSNGVVTTTRVSTKMFDQGSSEYCTFRAAASPYVDRNGQLLLYCHTHHAAGDGDLKLTEHGP